MKFIGPTDTIILQILTFIISIYLNKIAFDRQYPLSWRSIRIPIWNWT